MIKCSVFVATSLDGYIARPDGSIDWLNQANTMLPDGEDAGFSQFMSSVDALVMGRNTYEQVLTFGEWPYPSTPVIIMSRQLKTLPQKMPQMVSLSSEKPQELVNRLAADGFKHLYVDGGLTIRSFLVANLIDEITITLIPVLIGSGKPLFGALPQDIQLGLVSSKAYDFGFVQNKYRVIRE